MDINNYSVLLQELRSAEPVQQVKDEGEVIEKTATKSLLELKGSQQLGVDKLAGIAKDKAEDAINYIGNKINEGVENITSRVGNAIENIRNQAGDIENIVQEQSAGLRGVYDSEDFEDLASDLAGQTQSIQQLYGNYSHSSGGNDNIQEESANVEESNIDDVGQLGQLQHEAGEAGEIPEGAEIGEGLEAGEAVAEGGEVAGEVATEAVLDINPATMLIGAGLLIGSLFIHPNKNKETPEAPHVNVSHQFGLGQ